METCDALLLALQREPSDTESIDSLFRAFHTVKGMAGFLGLHDIQESADSSESLLSDVRAGDALLDGERLDTLFADVDTIRSLIAGLSTSGNPSSDVETKAAAVLGNTRRLADVRGSVRVDEERLDRLVDTIGELVIAQASVGQTVTRVVGGHDVVASQLAQLDKISRQLQEMATSMRMIPLRSTMRRMARLVRDLARTSGKPVDCVTAGEDVELDKSIVDGLADPLLHLVRNAIDHGIEPDADVRTARGKPAAATVTISARHVGGNIVIEVADDGLGLDREAIVRSARAGGLLTDDEEVPDEKVASLLFQPGFTTAKRVTDVSGRGVGMDVVKRAVDALRGSVAVSSSPGQGTSVRLTLPLTLAIIEGMVVRVADSRYIVPALSIVRTVCPEPAEVVTVLGRKEALRTDNGMVPVVRLARLFGLADGGEDRSDRLVMLVSDGVATTGLAVSELLGQQQIVIKSLGSGLGDVPVVSGAAILPDGSVGLILNIQDIVRLAHDRRR